MRVLIVSDTHGSLDNFERVLATVGPIDYLIHCGDVIRDEDWVRALSGCPCTVVRGNCDFDHTLPDEEVVTLEGHRVLVCHGHAYGVKGGTARLVRAAKEKNCDVAAYGHSHVPQIKKEDGVYVVNPGSLTHPRQAGRQPSYLMMTIDRRGQLLFSDNYLK
ncbi:MAG: metallophosphoesterase [Lachnospiraceae bacterium]|nr:metallophosphoesterase [Lachnospiraceae bacterium]